MYINKTVCTNFVDDYGRVIRRTTTYGKYKDYNLAVRSDALKGTVLQKQFLVWNDRMQKVVNKSRKESGGFEKFA